VLAQVCPLTRVGPNQPVFWSLVTLDGVRLTSGSWGSLDNLYRLEWNWTSKGDDEMVPVMIVIVLAVNTESVSSQVVVL